MSDKEKKLIEYQTKTLKRILFNGVSDYTIAKLYYYTNLKKFLYDEINEHWYIINKYNIWKKDKKGDKIKYDMCKSLNKLIFSEYSKFAKDKNITGPMKEILVDNYAKSIKYLERNKNKNDALNELKGLCKQEGIFEKMDNINPYLFAFNNGVYDLKNNLFRLPEPDELISCTCGYDYEEINDKIQKAIKYIRGIIRSMFEANEDEDVILMEIAQCLNAIPELEEFYIWKGLGRNGKGILRDLIKRTFGDYYDPIDIEYFNQTKHGKSAHAADEIMARKKNCRIVISTEPESNMKLKFTIIKMITGRDDIQCRHNYGSCFNFTPKFRLFFQSNYNIDIDNVPGQAKIHRTKIRNFPYVFVHNPVLDYQKKIDTTLKEKLENPIYKIAFFHILLNYYNKWVKNGKKKPESKNFNNHTNEYLAESDPFTPFYNKFIDDGIIKVTNDNKDYVKLSELFNMYKTFYVGENKYMTNKEFRAAIENKGLKVVLLHGYAIIRGFKIDSNKLTDFKLKTENIEFREDEPKEGKITTIEEDLKEENNSQENGESLPDNQEEPNDWKEVKKLNDKLTLNYYNAMCSLVKLESLETPSNGSKIDDNDLIIDHNVILKIFD